MKTKDLRPMEIRTLSESGRQALEDYLRAWKNGEHSDSPDYLLTHVKHSKSVPFSVDVERIEFNNRHHMARYLHEKIGEESLPLSRSPGVWSWLALFFIDQLIPGNEKPRDLYRYVLHGDETYRTYYRHQVYGPFSLYNLHGDNARLLLAQDVKTHPDVAEQFAARDEIVTNEALMKVADKLYYDNEDDKPKTGVTNRKKGGTMRRLIEVAYQLDLTYDIYGMSASDIIDLLPSEFDRWKPETSKTE